MISSEQRLGSIRATTAQLDSMGYWAAAPLDLISLSSDVIQLKQVASAGKD